MTHKEKRLKEVILSDLGFKNKTGKDDAVTIDDVLVICEVMALSEQEVTFD